MPTRILPALFAWINADAVGAVASASASGAVVSGAAASLGVSSGEIAGWFSAILTALAMVGAAVLWLIGSVKKRTSEEIGTHQAITDLREDIQQIRDEQKLQKITIDGLADTIARDLPRAVCHACGQTDDCECEPKAKKGGKP